MRPLPPDLRRRIANRGEGLTILVVRFGALGDVLRTLPAVRLVRTGLPSARLAWTVDDRWAAILDGHADLDAVVPFPRSSSGRARRWPAWLSAVRRWVRHLRREKPGLALDFHGHLRSGLAARWSGAPVRLGYAGHQQKEGNRWLTTHRVDGGPRRTSRIERNLSLVSALGLPDGPLPDAGLRIPAEAEAAARDIRSSTGCAGGLYAVVSPGASRRQAYKRPPVSLLAAAVTTLAARDVPSVVVYGPGEEAEARELGRAAGVGARLAPPTDLWTLAALLRGARMFVGGDTGPLHLACAVGCPAVGLYGPTDPVVNAPWRVPHRVVCPKDVAYTGVKRIDRGLGGFSGIRPDEVSRAVGELVAIARCST